MCKQTLKRKERKIIENKALSKGVYNLLLEDKSLCQEAKPGQFVNIYLPDKDCLLPRPISICEVDKARGVLRLVYAVFGKGTQRLSCLPAGQSIDIMGPLGHGFSQEEGQKLLIAGGVGTPPMLELAKRLPGEKIIVLGFGHASYLVEDLKQYGQVYLATESGKEGFHGNVIDLMKEQDISCDYFYACGPKGMLKALQSFALEKKWEGEFSLEERMGCGFGACVGCVTKIRQGDDFAYKKVCQEGPVFDYKEVIFQ